MSDHEAPSGDYAGGFVEGSRFHRAYQAEAPSGEAALPVTDQGRWLLDHQGLINIGRVHGSMRGDEIDLRASIVTIEAEAALRAEAGTLDADWIDHLPGITRVGDVSFGELMVPVSAVRSHYAALRSESTRDAGRGTLDVERLARAVTAEWLFIYQHNGHRPTPLAMATAILARLSSSDTDR